MKPNDFARPLPPDARAARERERLAADPTHRVRFGCGPVKDGFLNAVVRRDRP